MNSLKITLFGVFFGLSLTFVAQVNAAGLEFDMLAATPEGSWQLREDTNTDHKGRQTVTSIRTSMLGSELRDGETYHWVEMVINNFKVKKGKRKPSGDQAVIKSLMAAAVLGGDPANVMTNMRGLGKEIVIQNGKEDPMIIRGAGGMAGAIMKSFGTEVNFNFTDLGLEQIEVPAGKFEARKISGKGTTETKIMFKKIRVESDSTVWMSKSVPFGMVNAEGVSIINGKKNTNSTVLIDHGPSGASSLITKTPTELPTMPNIFNN